MPTMKTPHLKAIFISGILIMAAMISGCVSSPITSLSSSSRGSSAPSVQTPTKVALLVPLQTASGQSVRNGFLASYYYDKQQVANAPTVDVLDTSGGNVIALYQQAIAQGADFVVGPLTKEEVQTLASSGNLPVPVLALNTLDEGRSVRNLYQYGLSPHDEADQAAVRAIQNGHSRALIVAPDDTWGQGVARAFHNRFEASGGAVIESFAYKNTNLPEQIKAALQAGEAEKIGIERRTLPESRKDMDMIFLVAFPQQARQIKPLFRFYNIGNTPVYATSIVYAGKPTPTYDRDLDGIEFDDMPWLIGPEQIGWSEMRERTQTLWPASYNRYPRLYAMGIDAYNLTHQLYSLSKGSGFQGTTGLLYVDSSQRIKRQLEWARMQNGVPRRLSY
jgi:outer membrane PBP1 activator LpoA protein